MDAIRISAKTLDDAITKACIELGVTSESISYDIIEEGSNGFFGLGAKPYVISVKVKEKDEPSAYAKTEYAEKAKPNQNKETKPKKSEAKVNDRKADSTPDKNQDVKPSKSVVIPEADASAEEKAKAFLNSVFTNMGLEVKIAFSYEEDGKELCIDLSGDDMGVLIGKRGQTLDALQYLVGQVINKHRDNYLRVKLDTENYRERRNETLEKLAKNIAHKVKRTHRPVALEPMNPYERRIIHSVLQSEKDILTRSEGEEPYRHVVICPVRKKRAQQQG